MKELPDLAASERARKTHSRASPVYRSNIFA
jgi:hypothetical protein